jgi:DNA-binding IclR family transcriptional regulator
LSGVGDATGPNSRVIEVMNFLAAHPTESFTLAEIASRLGLSNGSAHRVLTTLADAKYLTRHPKHKTYSLGMVMVAIGQAALAQHREIDVVRREVARVAEELKVQCLAFAIVSNEMLIVACEGAPANFAPPNRVGERWPFVPPLGMGFIAWADDAARDDYLARSPAALNDRAFDRLAKSIELFRERGYGIAGDGAVVRALKKFSSRPAGPQSEESYWAGLTQLVGDISEQEIQVIDLDEAVAEGISYVTAPIFSSKGEVAYEISASGFAPGMSRVQIETCIATLREAATSATLQMNGSAPWIGSPGPSETPAGPSAPPRRSRRKQTS